VTGREKKYVVLHDLRHFGRQTGIERLCLANAILATTLHEYSKDESLEKIH